MTDRGIKFSPDEIDKATASVCDRKGKSNELSRAMYSAIVQTRLFRKVMGREIGESLAQDDPNEYAKRADQMINLAVAIGFRIGRNRGLQ